MQTGLLKVTGMTCGGCTSNVTHALRAINGVGDVQVSLARGEATVLFDERLTLPDHLKSAVKGAGYGVVDASSPAHDHQSKELTRSDSSMGLTRSCPRAHLQFFASPVVEVIDERDSARN